MVGQGLSVIAGKIDRALCFLNGDIRQHRIIHYEKACGKCVSRQQCIDNLTAALEDIVILPSGCLEPSKSRWGQTDASLALQAPGLLVHSLAGRLLKKAFPKYRAAEAAAESESPDNDYRRWLANKTYRATVSMSDANFVSKAMSALWAGRPMHWLWKRLEWLDAHECSLLDVADARTSPFVATQTALCRQFSVPVRDTDMRMLLHHFSLNEAMLLQTKRHLFQIMGSAYAQHHWRFIEPLGDAALALLKWSAEVPDVRDVGDIASVRWQQYLDGRRAAVHAFFQVKECCLERRFAKKLRQMFPSAESMLKDKYFWRALRLFGRYALIANMGVERLLAQVRQSINHKLPFLERLCSNGFLSPCLSLHTASGGKDPRVEDAEDMRDLGVPLARFDKAANRASRPCAPGIAYANAHAGKRPRPESQSYAEFRRSLHAEYQDLPAADKQKWLDKCSDMHAQKVAENYSAVPDLPDTSELEATGLLGLGDKHCPVKDGTFLTATAARADSSFASWGLSAREEFKAHCFIPDSDSISKSLKLKPHPCCRELHFGLCKDRDKLVYSLVLSSGLSLWQYCVDYELEFSWVRAFVGEESGADGSVQQLQGRSGYFWVARVRKSSREYVYSWKDCFCVPRASVIGCRAPSYRIYVHKTFIPLSILQLCDAVLVQVVHVQVHCQTPTTEHRAIAPSQDLYHRLTCLS